MSAATYTELIDLAAGTLLLTAVLIVWRRQLTAMVRTLTAQGIALAAVPLIEGAYQHDATLIAVAVAVLVLRAVILPALLNRAVRADGDQLRESTPLLNTTASLLVAAALTMTAFAVSRPLVAVDTGSAATQAAPTGVAVILIAVFVMVTRRRALSQAMAFLMLDNGIAAVAFLITAGVPAIVELGASLDVLFAVLILGVLTGRLRRTFGQTDLDLLRELHD
jgi:hydrogenase-4 component E